MEDKLSRAMKWVNDAVSEPYYMFHFIAFFSYFIVRTSSSQLLFVSITDRLFHREIQAALAFGVLIAIKFAREETWEGFVGDTIFFGKVFLIALALIMDRYLALWYFVVFSVIYVLTQQPTFSELGDCSKLTPLQLEALLIEGNTSRFWLVEFRSSCSPPCIRSSRCFPELSITYSNKNLSFGIVDLGLFPNAAEKFGIFVGGGTDQLPTYILFDNASGIARFPELTVEARSSHPPVSKSLISRYFELDRRLLEYVNGK